MSVLGIQKPVETKSQNPRICLRENNRKPPDVTEKTLKHLPISLETIYWEWKSYWKWPLTVDLPIKMVIFHCKRLPEGTSNHIPQNPRFVCVPLPTCWPLPPTIASIARGTESCHSQGFCRVTSKQAVGEDSIQRGAVSKAACGWCLDMFPRHLIGA